MKLVFTFCFIYVVVLAFSQKQLYSSGQTITFQSGALIYFQGTFTNTNTGQVQNSTQNNSTDKMLSGVICEIAGFK